MFLDFFFSGSTWFEPAGISKGQDGQRETGLKSQKDSTGTPAGDRRSVHQPLRNPEKSLVEAR